MQLNIKNREAYRLATELANLTGETLTEAVTRAIAERVAREKASRETLSQDAIAVRREAAKQIRGRGRALRAEGATSEHAWLYDENGAPR